MFLRVPSSLCVGDESKDNSVDNKEHTDTNTPPPPPPSTLSPLSPLDLSLLMKARPISSRGRSTGKFRAVTWRWRQVTPASSPRTGCCARRCSRTPPTRSPKARRPGSTCTTSRTTRRTGTRCAPAPRTPPRPWAPAPPPPPSGCCHPSGRSRWPSAPNCYDTKARDRVPELTGGGPVDTNLQLEYLVLILSFLLLFCFYLFGVWSVKTSTDPQRSVRVY